MTARYYSFDLSIVHGIIFILPCIILSLFKLWTKIVAKSQAEIISRKLNEELVKLVWILNYGMYYLDLRFEIQMCSSVEKLKDFFFLQFIFLEFEVYVFLNYENSM